jgi:TPR repeat protein
MSPTVLTLRTAEGLHQISCPMDSFIDIGSAPECGIVLDGGNVLPWHCVLHRVGEKRFRLRRAVTEAWFTVNGVCAADLEVETPFRFDAGTEEITFDLVAEGEELSDQPVDEETKVEAGPLDVPSDEAQAAARASRRDYLLQPTSMKPRAGRRIGEVVIENSPVGAVDELVFSEPAASVTGTETTPPESKAEPEESSSLMFAGLVICGLMIGAIFYWQHYLDTVPLPAGLAVEEPPAAVARELSDDEVVALAAELRMAQMPMFAAHLVMPIAEAGRVDAMHELALAFLHSGGFSEEAVYLLRQAAGGSRAALADLVDVVENPMNMARYDAGSFKHLSFAAQLGETAAWMPLGERLEQGHGVERDLDLALAAYEKANAAGEHRAAIKLSAKKDALECVAAFVRSWNEVSVATLLDHVSVSPQHYFGQEKPTMEALLRAEEQMRSLWPLRRISVSNGAKADLRSFDLVGVTQPFQFELQRGERIARGMGVLTCEVERGDNGWRVVSARDEIALKELLPAGDQFVSAESLRQLKPAFSRVEQMEETRLEILEKMRGIEETQDFKPALTLILNAAMTFAEDDFWRPFADKLCDRMAREFFAQGHWLDAAWSAPVHQLAELGSVSAMLLEGHLLMAGYGFTRDEKRGLELYQKAFELGKRRDARFYYAEALFQGRGVPQDFEKSGALVLSFMTRSKHPLEAYLAAHLLWRKAEINPALWQQVYDTLSRVVEKHPPARHLAAMVLLNHGNTTRERKTGFAALKAAAEAGVPEAMKNLSKCYQDGVGCEKDFQAATLWKQKALVTEPLKRRHFTEFEE